MRIQNIGSNQTVITLANGNQILVSYSVPVAAFIVGRGYIKTEQYYSKTTSKHINKWTGAKDAPTMPQSFFDSLLEL